MSFLKIGKIALFVCIYGLNSHLKCSFKGILDKKHKNFPCGALLVYELFMEVSLFQKNVLPCAPITLILTFHLSFHPNI